MRKSKNYYKFMEYMAFGISGWHENAVMVDNGVIECVAYAKVEYIEDYSKLYECNYDKMAMDSDNTWLTIKCVLVNEEVINVYYVTNERNRYIGQLVLDDYRTQKQALDAIHKKVVCFFLNSREFCEFHATEEEPTETTHHDEIDTYQPHIYIDTDNIKYLMETHSFPSTPTHEPTSKKVQTSSIYGMFGQYPSTPYKRHSYREVDKVCGDCSHFNACMQGNQTVAPTCCMFDSLYRARKNPNWHHVSLATLANIDNDMLDDKRRLYLTVYHELNKTIKNLRKCNSGVTYDKAQSIFRQYIAELYTHKLITGDLRRFIEAKISMCNVECGVWSSEVEVATGQHKSRKYNRPTLRY